jgi:hypothetical protein
MVELKVIQALENNKLNTLIFNDPSKVSHDIFRAIFKYIESNPVSENLKKFDVLSKAIILFLTSKSILKY